MDDDGGDARGAGRGPAARRVVPGPGAGVGFDFYFRVLRAGWPGFVAGYAASYVLINAAFAAAYMAFPGSVSGAAPGDFGAHFFFSMQTFSTVGYGQMAPGTFAGQVLAGTEMSVGLFFTAVATGLIFARLSLPRSRVCFSDVAVVSDFDGRRSLRFRLANVRGNRVVNPGLRVTMLAREVTAEGTTFRRFRDLKLTREHLPFLALTWLAIHPLDEASPLAGLTPDDLRTREVSLHVSLTGLDETYHQQIHASKTYAPDEILFGRVFEDVLAAPPGGGVALRIENLSAHRPASVAPARDPAASGGGIPAPGA